MIIGAFSAICPSRFIHPSPGAEFSYLEALTNVDVAGSFSILNTMYV